MMQVGRNAKQPLLADLEKREEARLLALENIKHTGYKYLKPPGVTKTLKRIHEEEMYHRELSSYSSRSIVFDSHSYPLHRAYVDASADRRFLPYVAQSGSDEEPQEEAQLEEAQDGYAEEHNNDEVEDTQMHSSDLAQEQSWSENAHSDDYMPSMNASFPSMYFRNP